MQRAGRLVVQAGPPRPGAPRGPGGPPPPPGSKRKIDRGFFSEVDTKTDVLPVRGNLAKKDLTQRPKGRYEPEFIWNTNWQEQLEFEESIKRQQAEGQAKAQAGGAQQQGYLRLTSKVDLNSMDVDLSAQLKPRKKPERQQQAGAGASGRPAAAPAQGGYPELPPSRVESRGWQRGSRYGTKLVSTPAAAAEADELAARIDAENARYEELKQELAAWAGGLAVFGLAATYAFYGRDVAASYGVGALGGLVYLRLLARSVDAVGGGGIGGALGQPRLLIPIILALGYNRYNQLAAAETGVHLQLLPLLVGFFTYKGAVVAKQALTLFGDLAAAAGGTGDRGGGSSSGAGGSKEEEEERGGGGGGGTGSGGTSSGGYDVQSVDRAFARNVLRG